MSPGAKGLEVWPRKWGFHRDLARIVMVPG
jgi:hypothetical protein